MNIACETCSTKYSIADDKVRGKVIKIRCKKCSNVIVVKGSELPAEEPAQKETHVFDYAAGDAAGADGGWHLVIDGEQVGPLSVSDISTKLKAGEIDAETYVWREGQDDWKPLSEVERFAKAIAAASKPVVAATPAAVAAAAAAVEGPEDDVGDLFVQKSGAISVPKPAEVAAAPEDEDDDDDGKPATGKLRGERNENSVLFSLGNLSALADGPAAKPASSSSSASASASGGASLGGSEGSGLIDIRSMASAYLGGAAPTAPKKAGSGFDELPVFSSPAAQEQLVIIPPVRQASNNKPMMIMLAAVAGLAIIALLVVVLVVMKTDKSTSKGTQVASGTGSGTEHNAGNGPGTDEDQVVDAAPARSGTDEASASGTGTATGTGKATGSGSASGTSKGTSRGTGTGTSHGSSRGSGTGTSRGSGTGTGTATKPPKADDCPDKVGCLVADKPPKCCEKYNTKGTGSGTGRASGSGSSSSSHTDDSDLPEILDNKMIKAGVDKVKSKVMACREKAPLASGTLKLKVKVSNDGSITGVSVTASLDPELDACAAAAIKGAQFPATQKPSSFTYPFPF